MEILIGGAKINRSFYRDFNKLFRDIDTASNLDDKQIVKAIANSHGVKNPLLVPVRAFDKIVQSLLDQYNAPTQKCVQYVREILEAVVQDSMSVLSGYPRLKKGSIKISHRRNGQECQRNHQSASAACTGTEGLHEHQTSLLQTLLHS